MSLHIGVIRFGTGSSAGGLVPALDLLIDTSELAGNDPVFAHVAYEPVMVEVAAALEGQRDLKFGTPVQAF